MPFGSRVSILLLAVSPPLMPCHFCSRLWVPCLATIDSWGWGEHVGQYGLCNRSDQRVGVSQNFAGGSHSHGLKRLEYQVIAADFQMLEQFYNVYLEIESFLLA